METLEPSSSSEDSGQLEDNQSRTESQKDEDHFVKPMLPSATNKKTEQTPQIHQDSKTQASGENKHHSGATQEQHSLDKLKQMQVPYTEPIWSGKAEEDYSFEVLKNGSIINTVPLSSRPYHVFGRLPSCDVQLEHPSLSRHHAVVQYSVISTETHEKGWYVYDLDSTHGTWVNKKRIAPKVYHRLKVGYILKFGGSSRLHILQGPVEDKEEESEMTITEMKEQKERLEKEAELLRQAELQQEMDRREADKKAFEDRGCGWGMSEDAEDVGGENPYASLVAENESLYIDDPKKALKGFYDREGCDLPDYQFTEVGQGKHKCVLDLPVDGPNGEDLVAEAVVSGKRRDAVIACALEACRILDKFGLLRASTHESRKRKQKKWEDDDFYDSDEDTFLDRTGTIEKKRFQRMKKAGKDEAETYDSLLKKYNEVVGQIHDIETRLQKAKEEAEALASEEMDELDAYMVSIKAGAMDTKTKMQLKGDLMRLKTEEQKLRKLVNLAKPASLPSLTPLQNKPIAPVSSAELLERKLHSQQKHHKKSFQVKTVVPVEVKPDNYEEEEEEEMEGQDWEKVHKDDSENKGISSRLQDPTAEENVSETNMPAEGKDSHRLKDIEERRQSKVSKPAKTNKSERPVVKGPSLPPVKDSKKSSKPISSTAAVLENLGKEHQAISAQYNSDPNYTEWLPPEGQTGDGRTDLNKKLGY